MKFFLFPLVENLSKDWNFLIITTGKNIYAIHIIVYSSAIYFQNLNNKL